MTEVVLRPKGRFSVPIEASAITPENFASKTPEQMMALEAWEGNRRTSLGSLFDVEVGEVDGGEEIAITIVGDASKLRRVGKGMRSGRLTIEGRAGMYLGEAMRGGTVTVSGDAGSWLGAHMRGGAIEVKGDAGDYVGSAPRGSGRGMKGGQILVHGSAGNELGCWMRGGFIRIGEDVGQLAGIHMLDGTILVGGDAEARTGAQMKGGRIVVMGRAEGILPSFSIEEARNAVRAGEERVLGPFYVFVGDLTEDGVGRLYISKERNPHLRFYESYIE